MTPDNMSLEKVEQLITDWHEPEIYHRYYPTKNGLVAAPDLPPSAVAPLPLRFFEKARQLGGLRVLPYSLGWLLRNLGKNLQDLASPDERDSS